jgi:predicted DNA binding CopG/RHH family protein
VLQERRESRNITIRMPLADLQAAREMAREKGLPYQTYMKMLLHQALEKERRAS